MAFTITDFINQINEFGVFSYIIPFLLIFAVVYAVLDKTRLLSNKENDNRGIIVIIAVAVALLAIQFDIVASFFSVIFPRFGVGISIFLCFVIFIGFFLPAAREGEGLKHQWVGWLIGGSVIVWAISSWQNWGDNQVGGLFAEYFWSFLILGGVVALIIFATKKKKDREESSP